jgi:Helix-turn-helix domain
MTAAWATNLPHTDKLVLLALADNANDEGFCWPSVATLAIKCGMEERSVSRVMERLESAAHLTRKERPGRSNTYVVHPRPIVTPTPDPQSPRLKVIPTEGQTTPDPQSPPPLTLGHPTPDPGSPITIIEPPIESSGNRQGRAPKRARSRIVPSDFEITPEMRKWAKEAVPNVDVDAQTLLFRDHEFRDPHSNWVAAWRTWMRRTPEFQRPGSNGFRHAEDTGWKPPKGDPKYDHEARRPK